MVIKFVDRDLVKVDAEQFKSDADVVAERKCLKHVHDVVAVVDVLPAQVLEYAHLLLCLSVKPLLVTYDLERHLCAVLVVFGSHNLTEASSPKTLQVTSRPGAVTLSWFEQVGL